MNLETSSDPSRPFFLYSSVRPASANSLQINMTISKSLWVPAQNLVATICQTDSPNTPSNLSPKHYQLLVRFSLPWSLNMSSSPPAKLNFNTHSNLMQNGEGLMMLKLITLMNKCRECRREREDLQEPSGLALWTSAGQICHVKPLLVKGNILDHQKNLLGGFPNHRFSLKNICKDFTALFCAAIDLFFILRRQIFQGLTQPMFSGFASVIK